MSDPNDEKNPNKTVFRPSPLQGLRNPGQPPQPTTGTMFVPASQPQAPPQPGMAPPPGLGAPVAAAQTPVQAPARRAVTDDDIPMAPPGGPARNPMMVAAAPVLALIASVRSGRAQMPLPDLHQKASAAVGAFDQALGAANYPAEIRQRARYAVCATIDDIAQNLPGQAVDGAEWARRSLVVQAFNENIGGDRFWRLLEEMLQRPAEYADLIELYHACLAVGFEGRYRIQPDGKSRLHEIMTSTYAALAHPRALSQRELSPHWKGEPTPATKVSFWATLALAAAVALALLLVVFILFRVTLIQTGQPSIQALRTINPSEPLRMSRVAAAPPAPTSTQMQRIRMFLAPEIAQHLVAVDQDARSVRVRTTIGDLFRSGSDALSPGRDSLFKRIAAAIQSEPGAVSVEGHADADRQASLAFPDNLALSKARAETAAKVIRSGLTNPARVSVQGFGDTQPIASNATPDGKALNRRVEVVIPRAQ